MKGSHTVDACAVSVVGGKLVPGAGRITHTPLQRRDDGSLTKLLTFWIYLMKATNNFKTLTFDIYLPGSTSREFIY